MRTEGRPGSGKDPQYVSGGLLVEAGCGSGGIGACSERSVEIGREPFGVDSAAVVQFDDESLPVEPLRA